VFDFIRLAAAVQHGGSPGSVQEGPKYSGGTTRSLVSFPSVATTTPNPADRLVTL